MKRLATGLLCLGTLISNLEVTGQSTVDSILTLIEEEDTDSIKLKHYLRLIPEVRKTSPAEALIHGETALQLAKRAKDINAILLVKTHNANSTRAQGDNAGAKQYFEEILKEADDNGVVAVQGASHVALSRIYEIIGEYDVGVEHGQKGERIYKALEDSVEWISAINNIGNNHLGADELDSAMVYYSCALKLSNAIGNRSLEANALSNLAIVLYRVDDIEKALNFTAKSASLYRLTNQKEALGTAYTNMAYYSQYVESKKDSTIPFLEMATRLYEEVGYNPGLSSCYNALGIQYNDQKQPQKALEFHKKGLNLAILSGAKLEQARILSSIGHDYKNLNNRDSAFYYLNTGMSLAVEMKRNDLVLKLHDSYVNFHEYFGEFQDALAHSKSKSVLRDSLYGIEKLSAIEDITIKYEAEKKEQENQLLLLTIRNRNSTIYFSVGLSLMLALIVGSLIVAKRQERKRHIAELNSLQSQVELFKVKRDHSLKELSTKEVEYLDWEVINTELKETLDENDQDVIRVWFNDISLTRREVAEKLLIGENGLKSRIRKIFRKLDVNSKEAAVKRILEMVQLQEAS